MGSSLILRPPFEMTGSQVLAEVSGQSAIGFDSNGNSYIASNAGISQIGFDSSENPAILNVNGSLIFSVDSNGNPMIYNFAGIQGLMFTDQGDVDISNTNGQSFTSTASHNIAITGLPTTDPSDANAIFTIGSLTDLTAFFNAGGRIPAQSQGP